MFGLKKRNNHGNVGATINGLREWLSPLASEIKGKLRFDGRVRLLNRKARHHPKRLLVSFISVMLIIGVCDFSVTVITAGGRGGSVDKKLTSDIVPIGEVIETMRKIEENRQYPQKVITAVAQEGLSLTREIDSINSLKSKTPEDSALLRAKMKQAIIIYELINHEKN